MQNIEEDFKQKYQDLEVRGDPFAAAYKFDLAQQVREAGLYPYFKPLERNDGATALLDGREVIMLGSNNYLGLTADPDVRKAAADYALKMGSSMSGSRFLNGTIAMHEELERELADFVGKPAALVFTTGYQANIGALSALMPKGSVAIVDKYAHASIRDAVRVGGARIVKFKHNDMADLERRLQETKGTPAMVIVDGVYSMEGDLAPLPDIVKLTGQYNARLYVDDAHGIGVMGDGGRGTVNYFGLTDKVDVIVGTFSKSLASIGGFVAADERVIDFIRHFGRSMVFSASLPPANTAAAMTALHKVKADPGLPERARKNGALLKQLLLDKGFDVSDSVVPIVSVIIGDELTCLTLSKAVIEAGVYVNPVVYPAVPRNRAVLRTSTMATHTREQIEQAVNILADVAKNFGIL